MTGYHITLGDGRTTEELVAAANYSYCHSQVFLDNFPARPFNGETQREIVLLTFDRPMSSEDATAEVAKQGLERPYYEDALYFGIKYPEAHSWKRRLPPSMTLGWATMAVATLSSSGAMRGAGTGAGRV